MGFSRQEYWSGLPFPSPGDLPHAGFKPGSPTLQADSLSSEPPRYLQIWGQKNRERNGTSLLYGNTWRGLGFTLYLEAVCFSGSLISFPLIRFPPNPKSLVGFCPWVLSESLEGSPSGKTIALWFLGTRSKVILEQKYKPGSFLSQNQRPFAERSLRWVIPRVGSVPSILRVIFAVTTVTSLLPKAIFLTFSKLCSKPSLFWTRECWLCWQDPKSPPWSTLGFSYTSQHEPCSCKLLQFFAFLCEISLLTCEFPLLTCESLTA